VAVEAKRGNTMSESTKDKTEGALHEAKGAVKEKIGKVFDDPNLEAEGAGEKAGGKFQKKVGQVEEVVEKATKKAKEERRFSAASPQSEILIC
jgi:uncharacterized protein YjbJ (UPF0337 family)